MRLVTHLAVDRFDPATALQVFLGDVTTEGAVVSFVGIARPTGADGEPLVGLFLDHHPRLTLRSLETIGASAGERFPISAALIVHRCGEVLPGEPIVLAAAAARSRRAAFEATDYMMDRLKTEAVFWKREDGLDGSRWIEPSEQDYLDRARWNEQCQE